MMKKSILSLILVLVVLSNGWFALIISAVKPIKHVVIDNICYGTQKAGELFRDSRQIQKIVNLENKEYLSTAFDFHVSSEFLVWDVVRCYFLLPSSRLHPIEFVYSFRRSSDIEHVPRSS